MPLKFKPTDPQNVVDKYLGGMSILELSEEYGIGRYAIGGFLRSRGVKLRSMSEAKSMHWTRMDPMQRTRQFAAAHEACQGRHRNFAERLKGARTKMRRRITSSVHEKIIWTELDGIGMKYIPQFPIGTRNVDIAIDGTRIAVEIWGGCWHTFNNPKTRKQIEYILNRKWTVLIVVCRKPSFDYRRIAEYIHSFSKKFCMDETVRGQYWVIGGDAKPLICPCYNLNGRTRIKGLEGQLNII